MFFFSSRSRDVPILYITDEPIFSTFSLLAIYSNILNQKAVRY